MGRLFIIRWLPSAAVCCFAVCGTRRMSLSINRLRPSSTAALAAPLLHPPPAAQRLAARFSLASPVKIASSYKKTADPFGSTVFLELLARFELATSSLPRMRSTGWAIAAYCADSLCIILQCQQIVKWFLRNNSFFVFSRLSHHLFAQIKFLFYRYVCT